MILTFLGADVPLTKTFTREAGKLVKHAYPNVYNCSSYQEEVKNIEEFKAALDKHAKLGHCLLKGNVSRPLVNESRANSTDANAATNFIVLDIDGLKGVSNVNDMLLPMEIQDVDHIIQYSSSMGVDPDRGLSAHVFMLCDADFPPRLKQWLTGLNLKHDILLANVGLSRTNNSIRWPLDITTCQNDKLIYIAPPILGPDVKDTLKGKRIVLVKGTKRSLPALENIPTPETNKKKTEALINALREKKGLELRKKPVVKTSGIYEYTADPDKAVVTGIRPGEIWTHLNLNGGDSFGYYHLTNNPEFIQNFKGEPVYKTSELVPDYWATVKQTLDTPKPDGEGTYYLAFRDFRTATYHNGIWNSRTNVLDIHQAKGTEQLRHFLKQYGAPVPGFIPDWNIYWNPAIGAPTVDIEGRKINTFQPSEFMRHPVQRAVHTVPPTIKKIIMNMLGNDETCFERYLNWVAVIMQHRKRTDTGWSFNGTQGTGKGIMVDKILKPLFGEDNVIVVAMKDMTDTFNGFLERKLIVFIDEAELNSLDKKHLMDSKLKGFITGPTISIRRMHTQMYTALNYMNLVLLSNKRETTTVGNGDRRWSIAPYQPNKLDKIVTDHEIDVILPTELQDFYDYLNTREADDTLAQKCVENDAKTLMKNLTMQGMDVAIKALQEGDYQFFVDHKTIMPPVDGSHTQEIRNAAYNKLVDDMFTRTELLREELHILLEHTIGNMPKASLKFASYLKHHNVDFKAITHNGAPAQGISISWK